MTLNTGQINWNKIALVAPGGCQRAKHSTGLVCQQLANLTPMNFNELLLVSSPSYLFEHGVSLTIFLLNSR